MTTWNIYKLDGHYVGQAAAASAESAFCRYMSLYHTGPAPLTRNDVQATKIEPGVYEIMYKGETYILRAM